MQELELRMFLAYTTDQHALLCTSALAATLLLRCG